MPIRGRERSRSVYPTAFSMARAGARCGPSTRVALRRFGPFSVTQELYRPVHVFHKDIMFGCESLIFMHRKRRSGPSREMISPMSSDLDSLRQSLDAIDEGIVDLLARRQEAVREVAAFKGRTNAPLR